MLTAVYRKFYTIVMSINMTMLVLAAANVWDYPRRYTGAFILGNLFFAILMRNELFGRMLYATVNFLFAKVSRRFVAATFSHFYLAKKTGFERDKSRT